MPSSHLRSAPPQAMQGCIVTLNHTHSQPKHTVTQPNRPHTVHSTLIIMMKQRALHGKPLEQMHGFQSRPPTGAYPQGMQGSRASCAADSGSRAPPFSPCLNTAVQWLLHAACVSLKLPEQVHDLRLCPYGLFIRRRRAVEHHTLQVLCSGTEARVRTRFEQKLARCLKSACVDDGGC